jgi:hypothetical protein
MNKIETVTYMLVRDEDVEFNATNYFSFGATNGVPLYGEDTLQTVAETILSKVQEEINKHVILDEDSRFDVMFNRGLDKADAIVGDFDIASLINQLKGQ